MRARSADGRSRFARAKKGAADILASLRDGDAAAIVLAGAPARVGLAATTDVARGARGARRRRRKRSRDRSRRRARDCARRSWASFRRSIAASSCCPISPTARPTLRRSAKAAAVPVWVAMPELARAPLRTSTAGFSPPIAPARACACASRAPRRTPRRDARSRSRTARASSPRAPLPQTALGEASLTRGR